MADVTFEIVKSFGVIATNSSGWMKELNLVSWNDRPAKIEIREWSPDHTKMSRGLTFTTEETEELYSLLTEALADSSWQ